jgi:hypothetical protein
MKPGTIAAEKGAAVHALPDQFRRIRLELARESAHPEGDRRTGYELVAPLDDEGRLDAELWRAHKDNCRVRRFRGGENDEIGRLARHPGGSWYFDYDPQSSRDDEAGFRLKDERFRPGEYVSIADEGGTMHTYRVVAVAPV